jgi:hypothetical protein
MGVVFSKTQAPLLDFEYYTEWQKQQIAVNREMIKRARQERKKNIKPDNKKKTRNTKTYYDTFDI